MQNIFIHDSYCYWLEGTRATGRTVHAICTLCMRQVLRGAKLMPALACPCRCVHQIRNTSLLHRNVYGFPPTSKKHKPHPFIEWLEYWWAYVIAGINCYWWAML